jgi:hypothetical protein
MHLRIVRRLLITLAAVLAALTLVALPMTQIGVAARSVVHLAVNISLSAPASVSAGAAIPVSVHVSAGGGPVVLKLIRFYIAGVEVGAAKTNYSGDAAKSLHGSVPAGTQTLTAVFRGSGRYDAASASRSIVIVAAELSIRVVPFVPNSITVSINGGVPIAADSAGYINASVPSGKRITLQAVVQNPNPHIRVSFVEWSNGDTSTTRSVHVGAKYYTQIALQTSFLTPLIFEDGVGAHLPASELKDLNLVGPDGSTMTVRQKSAIWLSTPVPRRTTTGALEVGDQTYTLVTGDFHGVNVADQGLDRFVPSAGGRWTVRLRVFPMKLVTRNTVLGGQIGASVLVSGPGSSSRRLDLSDHGATTLLVPVGRYSVKILSGGFGPTVKVRVSRPATVPLPMITPIDIGGGGIIIVVIVLGFLAMGPWRHRVVDWIFAGQLR